MTEQKVTVIGAGVGGLTVAALLSQQGVRVRVVEKSMQPGGKCSVRRTSSGFLFDEGPSILVLRHIYEDFFKRVGRNMADYLDLETLDPAFAISSAPNTSAPQSAQTFFIHAEFEKTLASLGQIDANAALELRALVHSVDAFADTLGLAYADRAYSTISDVLRAPLVLSGLRISPLRKYKEFVDAHIHSPLLREFLYGFPGYAGYHPASAPASLILLPWSILREGVFYPRGGVSAIVQALFKICIENGCEFQFGTEVVGFDVNHGRIETLKCKSASAGAPAISGGISRVIELARAEKVIFNGDLAFLANKLAPEFFSTAERERFSSQSPSFFTLQMGVDASWLARYSLSHHNLFLPGDLKNSYQDYFKPGAPYPQNPPLYLNVPSVSDSTVAPLGKANLFLVVSVPSHTTQNKVELACNLEKYGRHCVQLLQAYLPDFPQQPDPFYCKGSLQFEADLNQWGGQIYGPSLGSAQIMGGLFRPHPSIDQLSNCYLVGTSTQPGAGLPMVIQSGKIVADLVLSKQ